MKLPNHPPIRKRFVDLALTIPVLLLMAPMMAGIALLVRIFLGRPVLFRQFRPGYLGRPFVLLKFRTMTDQRDSSGKLLPDARRLTGFGKLLRNTSLDELPELVNVLRGDMSLVGPRPLLTQYLERYSAEQMRRHDVLPGITGWAQVRGRNALSWNQKFACDLWYVDHQSLSLDFRILLMTAVKIIRSEGISSQDHATMPEFMGNRPD